MSGSKYKPKCSCAKTRCLTGMCKCFKAGLFCSGRCRCYNCLNTKNNKAEVKRLRKKLRKAWKGPPSHLGGLVPLLDELPVPDGFDGCKCPNCKCASKICPCLRHSHRCTLNCQCRDCANSIRIERTGSNNELGQGSAGDVSNIHEEAVEAALSSNIKSVQTGDISSKAEEPRDNKGFDQNK